MISGARGRKKRFVAFRSLPVGACFIADRGKGHKNYRDYSTWVYRKISRLTAEPVSGDGYVEHQHPNKRVQVRACRRGR